MADSVEYILVTERRGSDGRAVERANAVGCDQPVGRRGDHGGRNRNCQPADMLVLFRSCS